MSDNKPVKIAGTVFWAYLDKVNELSGKYQFDLCQLSDRAIKTLESMGIEVKNNPDKPEQGYFITYKSVKYPIRVYDTSGNELDNSSVGNGTKAEVVTGSYAWTFKKKEGVSPSALKVVVTDLVPYQAGTVDADDELEAL